MDATDDTRMAKKPDTAAAKVAVVIPCFRVQGRVLDVIDAIGPEVTQIFVIDDRCPESTGDLVEQACKDSRVTVIRHDLNQGVGGATMTGIAAAVEAGADVIVKVDGDGQMDPAFIPFFIRPILDGQADYAKGNRFFDVQGLRGMPAVRVLGNAALSFFAKLSTGYWNIFDPTNGYVAINGKVAALLPFERIAKGYFFETDILFRLNILGAVVIDIPMDAVYGEEESNLKIGREGLRFFAGHLRNFFKRLFYNYYLRNFSVASLEIVLAVVGLGFGFTYGVAKWAEALATQAVTPAGTVMLAALPTLIGMQALLAFINHDIQSVPRTPLHTRLCNWPAQAARGGRKTKKRQR